MAALFPVLLVDDNPHIADLLNRAAKSAFTEAAFIAVGSFAEAATYLEGLRGRGPRLVLLDLDLQGGLTGLDFLTVLQEHPQGRLVPVVVLSATQDTATVEACYRWGASAFTQKPFSFAGWKAYVGQLRSYWHETVTTPQLWFDQEPQE